MTRAILGPLSLLVSYKAVTLSVVVSSAAINMLYLTGSFFMLQVYDRVLASKSVPTLVVLGILTLMLYCFQCAFDVIRARILVRAASEVDEAIGGRIFKTVLRRQEMLGGSREQMQPIQDADQVRSFIAGPGLVSLFDLPWLPLYITICFLFHSAIGYVALGGVLLLGMMTLATHFLTGELVKVAGNAVSQRNAFGYSTSRNSEVISALGMTERMCKTWEARNSTSREHSNRLSDFTNGFSAISKMLRLALQSSVLAVGAFLVIQGEASGGIIIAGSILTARALAPLEAVIGNWRSLLSALDSWSRLKHIVLSDQTKSPLILPKPQKSLSVERLWGGPPAVSVGNARTVVSDISFELKAGDALGIIGPSASGKSTLVRFLVGVWQPHRGTVRLDGAAVDQWDNNHLGKHTGYLPQGVELFAGTIADNISRFNDDASPSAIVAAARAARVHDMILRLPKGYDTEIGDGGVFLSAGQRQRIALARALFDEPFLVVLDEPNSNLDAEGEDALNDAIRGVRARGGIVIVVAHRPAGLSAVNLVLSLRGGRVSSFGQKEQVLVEVLRNSSVAGASTLKIATEMGDKKVDR